MQHPRFKPFDIRWSATIDHVIPLAKGGPDVWENVQATHCLCNGQKGDGQVGERLKPPDCKSGPYKARAGSNPALSTNCN
jgi:5-methylcytosine-specific restriction endonuclease McrA